MKLNSRSISELHICCFTAPQRAAETSDRPPIVRANGLKQYLVTISFTVTNRQTQLRRPGTSGQRSIPLHVSAVHTRLH